MATSDKAWWKRLFGRKQKQLGPVAGYSIEKVVEDQAAWEGQHPVPYADDQRLKALVQRATRAYGSALPAAELELLKKACLEWGAATKAAEETP